VGSGGRKRQILPWKATSVGPGRFIIVRKLAALDLYFRRPALILLEFALVVFGFGALGSFALFFGLAKSLVAVAIGIYLLFLSVDYAPMLVYGVSITRKGSAKAEIEDELADISRSRMKYGLQQTLLMVPLFIPLLALWQEAHKTPGA
jgi:hypothetical protein